MEANKDKQSPRPANQDATQQPQSSQDRLSSEEIEQLREAQAEQVTALQEKFPGLKTREHIDNQDMDLTVDEALELVDLSVSGATFYQGKRDLLAAAALLALEVRRLRQPAKTFITARDVNDLF